MALYPLMVQAKTTEEAYYLSPTGDIALVPAGGIVIKSSTDGWRGETQISTTTPARQMVVYAFLDAPIMVRIAEAESQMVPSAKNPRSTATGLFQVLQGTATAYGCGDQTIAEESIKCARKIYEAEGTRPWASSSYAW